MQKTKLVSAAFLLPVFCLFGCNDPAKNEAPASTAAVEKSPAPDDPVKRGAYLVSIMGCNDCHSPKRMGPNGPEIIPELALSGFPGNATIPPLDAKATANGWIGFWADLTTAVGPWGQSYSGNITSDSTGIGTWTVEQFKKAITEGKLKGLEGTRPILPPMPWQDFKNLKDEDVKAIFAYLKTTKPVHNIVPAAKINPPPPKS